MDTMPGDAEAHAAIAGLYEQTPSGPYRPGMRVTCPRAFADGRHEGVIVARETDPYVGTVYRIDTPQGRQTYLPEELEVVS